MNDIALDSLIKQHILLLTPHHCLSENATSRTRVYYYCGRSSRCSGPTVGLRNPRLLRSVEDGETGHRQLRKAT